MRLLLLLCIAAAAAYRMPHLQSKRGLATQVCARATSLSADDDLGSSMLSFTDWCATAGVASHGALHAARLPGFGVSLVATGSIEVGATLLSVPSSLHLTPTQLLSTPLGAAIDGVVDASDDSARLALRVLQEVALGDSSGWSAYLKMLPPPDSLHVPLLWSDRERETLLRGSHLLAAVGDARAELLSQWASIAAVLPPPLAAGDGAFTAAGYLWAHAVVLSRGLPFGDTLSLIPMLDLVNHAAGSPNTCSIESSSLESLSAAVGAASPSQAASSMGLGGGPAAVITAGAALSAGEQIFIDYGESGWRSSWEMLFTYGFIPGERPEEWLASGGRPLFFEGIAEGDPLRGQKLAALAALGAGEGAGEGVWVDCKASEALKMAPILRLAHLGDDGAAYGPVAELVTELAEWRAEPRALWERLQAPLAPQLERQVAAQVLGACHSALATLPPAEDLAKLAAPRRAAGSAGAGEAAGEIRARLGARVVLGERAALEACAAVWEKAAAAAA